MTWLGRLARWWWRALLLLACIAGLLLLGLLLLPYTNLLPVPALQALDPPPGAVDVSPRRPLQMQFSTPMDQTSVEQAFQVTPSLPGSWSWPRPDLAVWQPDQAWHPATTYTLQLDTNARSRVFQHLPQAQAWQFSTAAAPTVTLHWPPSNALVDVHTALAVQFDRAISATASLTAPLTLTPSAPLMVQWLDDYTVIARADLAPGTLYTSTIAPVTDGFGTPLEPTDWHFSTTWPTLVDVQPAASSRITATEALTWQWQGIFAPTTLRALTTAVQLTPPISGTWRSSIKDGTTLLAFSPHQPWPASGITATLQTNTETTEWHWTTAQPVALVATLPGSGGTLDPRAAIRLIFSAPPNSPRLRSSLSLEPAVSNLTLDIDETQARLSGDFQPSTAYTLTINLDAQAPPLSLPFVTSAQHSELQLLDGDQPWSIWRPGTVPTITLSAPSLSATQAQLYPLDRALLLTSLRDSLDSFDPQRFNLSPLTTWSLSDTAQVTLALTPTLDAAQSAFLFEAQDQHSGQRIQQIIVRSPYLTQLTIGGTSADVLVLDAQTGAPVPNVPLVLLSNGSQVAVGQTGLDGSWITSWTPGIHPDAVIGGDDAALAWAPAPTSLLTPVEPAITAALDTDVVHVGQRVQIWGTATKSQTDQRTSLPLQLLALPDQRLVAQQSLNIDPSGAFSTTLDMHLNTPPGAYRVHIGADYALPLFVDPPPPSGWQLRTPSYVQPGTVLQSELLLRSANQQPLSYQVVDWQASTPDGSLNSQGTLITDATGAAVLNLPLPADLAADQLQLRLHYDQRTLVRTLPIKAQRTLQLTIDQAVVQTGATLMLTATLVDATGQPLNDQPVEIELQSDTLTQQLTGRTDAAGRLVLPWRAREAGTWAVQASSPGADPTTLTVWALRGGFRSWSSAERDLIAISQTSLAAAVPLQLVPLVPASDGLIRLTWLIDGQLSTSQHAWRASIPLQIIPPTDQPGRYALQITIISNEQGQLRVRTTQRSISIRPAATVAISTNVQTNTLRISTTDQLGQPLSGTLNLLLPTAAARPTQLISATTGVLSVTLPPQPNADRVLGLFNTAGGSQLLQQLLDQPGPPTVDVFWPPALQWTDETSLSVRLSTLHQPTALSVTATLSATPGLLLTPSVQRWSVPPGSTSIARWSLGAAQAGTHSLTLTLDIGPDHSVLTHTLHVEPFQVSQPLRTSQLITQSTQLSATLPISASYGSAQIIAAPGLDGLLAASSSMDTSNTPLATAGRIALAQTSGITPSINRDIALLLGSRNSDGGWSWDAGPSDPLISALIVRMVSAGPASPGLDQVLNPALDYLSAQLERPQPVTVQAAILAALARQQRNVGAQIVDLLERNTAPPLSQLLLIRALLDLRRERQAAQAAAQLSEQQIWQQPSSELWATPALRAALWGQILLRTDTDSPELAASIRLLAASWQGNGWGDPLATTEALMLFQALPGASRRPVPYELTTPQQRYTGTAPFSFTSSLSTTQPLTWTLNSHGPVSIATLLHAPEHTTSAVLNVWGQLRSPVTGQRLSSPQVNQPVLIDWLVLVREPLPYVEITLPSLSGLLIESSSTPQLDYSAGVVHARSLVPGVYHITLAGRLTLPGVLHWTAVQSRSGGRSLSVASDLAPIHVQP